MSGIKIKIAEVVADKLGISKSEAGRILATITGEIRRALTEGRATIKMRGFGTFKTKLMKGRVYDLQGVTRTTQDHHKVVFKPCFKP